MDYVTQSRQNKPYSVEMLKLDDLHTMHFQQSGSPCGQPVILLHGGPGAGIDAAQRDVLDPRHYRIIEADQRGAGRSTPLGELTNNTTGHLVEDIEVLRAHLGISQWLVMGGSWGSTLAIAYAQQYPKRVIGMLLRGVFLCSSQEIDWYLQGMRHVFPEAWERFITFLPEEERSIPLQSYSARLQSDDPETHLPAAKAWCYYEANCATMLPRSDQRLSAPDHQLLALARIQVHYFNAGFFLCHESLLNRMHRIRSIPTTIVQGRYDMICPITTANKLHRIWPQANYRIVPNAGHAASEPGIRRTLASAAHDFQQLKIDKTQRSSI